MIKKYSITCEHSIWLFIITCYPHSVKFSSSIRTSRMHRWILIISSYRTIIIKSTIELWSRSLIESTSLLKPSNTNCLEKTECSNAISISSIFWHVKTHRNMRLCSKIIYLIWTNIRYKLDKIRAISEITIVKRKSMILTVNILDQMINSLGIKKRGSPFDTMHFVSFWQK